MEPGVELYFPSNETSKNKIHVFFPMLWQYHAAFMIYILSFHIIWNVTVYMADRPSPSDKLLNSIADWIVWHSPFFVFRTWPRPADGGAPPRRGIWSRGFRVSPIYALWIPFPSFLKIFDFRRLWDLGFLFGFRSFNNVYMIRCWQELSITKSSNFRNFVLHEFKPSSLL